MGLFDDIPSPGAAGASPSGAAGKPRGLFDDLPATPEARAEPGGPLEITIRPPGVEERMRSFAPPPDAAEVMRAAPEPQKEDKGAANSLMQGHINSEAAKAQGSSALVRDRKGEFVRKPIGEVEHYDFGPMVRGQDGGLYVFNPKTDVMLRDPVTDKLIAFERDQEIDNPNWISKLWHAVAPGLATNTPSRLASSEAIPLAVERGRQLGFPVSPKTAQTGQRMADAGAFKDLGVEPFAPAFRSKGAARFARTIEEMPLIGGVVKGPKIETETALANAQQRISQNLGAAPSNEQAGYTLQQGLDRFKNAGAREMEPGVMRARGIEPNEPINPRDVMSAGAERRAARAEPVRQAIGGGTAQTNRGVVVPAAATRAQTLQARRGVESMSDAEIATLIRAPSRETSFATRQEALYEKAFRSVPALSRSNGSANPNMLAATNTRQTLAMIDRQIGNQIGGQSVIGGDIAARLRNPNASNFPLADLRAMRTEVGRALGSLNPQQTTLNSGQLNALYRALSQDIEIGLMDLANRAVLGTRVSSNRPGYVAPEIARRADQALRDFRVADRYTRQGMARIERFSQILNAKNPEQAMRTLETRMKEGTIDRGMVRAIRDALRPDERHEVLGYLVSRMGQGRPGAQEAERGWNIHGFATDWNRNKDALRLLMDGADPAVTRQLEALAQISERMKYYETTRNYSGTAYSGIPIITMASGLMTGGWGAVATLIGQVGGGAALGKFLTNPQYLNWMVRAARTTETEMAKGPQVAGSRWPMLVAQLERLAANDNELGPVILDALRVVNGKTEKTERDKP